MLPFFPSLPNHGGNDPPLQQGMMIPHLPNSPNPQFPVPMMGNLSNPNTRLSNLGGNAMGMPNQQQIFQNSPNMPPPMAQNNQMGIGVLPQNGSFALNQVMALQLLGQAAGLPQFQNQLQNLNFLSSVQLGGQFLANNLAQSMNQFAAGANGQLGVNIPVLFNGTTAPNSGSFGNSSGMNPSFGDAACVDAVNREVKNGQLASNHEMGSRNHNFRGIAPNTGGFGSNPNMAMSSSNANFHNAASNGVNCHAMGQGVRHGTPMAATKFRPPFSRSLSQSDGNNMVNCGEVNGSGVPNFRNEYSTTKNFRMKPKGHERGGISNVRTQKPQFHHAPNGKWNAKPFNRTGGRGGHNNGREGKSNFPNGGSSASTERRRFVPIIYSEHEIKQWIEARKKNFPTRDNIEKKKLALNGTNGEEAEENTKLCRQQLKEVLVKQAELGFEAPEIPPGYLSEPEGQLNGKPNENTLNRSDGSLNRYNNKRGKYNQRDRRGKRPKLKKEPTTPAPVAREPTLLRKLLNTEIKGDKSRLLQAFRFVLLNSFFESWPEKPLEFPSITVQDTIYRSTAALGANPSPNDTGVSNFRKTDDKKDSHVVEEQNRSCEGGDGSTNDADMFCDFVCKEGLKDSHVVDEAESGSSEDEGDSVSDDTEQLEDSEEGEITE